MNRILLLIGLLIVGVTPLFISGVVLASTLTLDGTVRAEARNDFGFIIDSHSNHLVAGPVLGSVSDLRTAHEEASYQLGPSVVDSVADAMYEGEARFGVLRGFAEAGTVAGRAFAELRLKWEDDFLIVSGVLPFGTPVDLRYTLFLESGIFSNQSCDGVSPPGPAIAGAVGRNGAAGIIANRACGPSDPQSVATIIHTTIGALLTMSGELNVGASVGSSIVSRPHNVASADAFNTARFFVDPVGSDFRYLTNSGVTYLTPAQPSPVPEPGAWLLLASGMVGLLGHGWLRRQRGAS